MAGWAWHDLKGDRKHKGGASTLTMQLAKLLFLSDNGTFKYKLIQIMVAFHLEHRFTKQQIFEIYANQINLGQRGSFSINGFGEAAQAYFGKDVRQLNLPESAMLAGIVQRPNYFNPFRHADRVLERRNLVLDSMVETGAITKEEAERAKATSLHLSSQSVDANYAPYFVDLVREQLTQKLGDRDFNREGLHIYTSLDPELQRAASEAVDNSMHIVGRASREALCGGSIARARASLRRPFLRVRLHIRRWRWWRSIRIPVRCWRWLADATTAPASSITLSPTGLQGRFFKPFVYATALTDSLAGGAAARPR